MIGTYTKNYMQFNCREDTNGGWFRGYSREADIRISLLG